MSFGRELNNLPLSAGLADARRVDPLKVIQSPISLTKQEHRRAYHRNRFVRLKSPKFECGPPAVEPLSITSPFSVFTRGPPAVEPRSITSPSSSFTDCESDSFVSIDYVAATNSVIVV